MKKEARSNARIEDDIRSAGKTFLGLRMCDLIQRVPELDDPERKAKLIQEYFENQIGAFDKDLGGTRTRVNSAVRIIKADMVLFALRKIDGSNKMVLPEAVDMAKETIRKIESGELSLPDLV